VRNSKESRLPKPGACGKKKVMPLLLTLLLTAAQGAEPPGSDLMQQVLPAPGQNLVLWLPRDYRKDPLTSWKFNRKPSAISNDVVTLRMALLERKLPQVPVPPELADLLKIDPSLTDVKFTGSVTTWKGHAVPTGSYEGFVQGKVGVYGRVVWLPLEPGTVALDFYSEPPSADAMNRDCDAILGALDGPIVEWTFRERAPQRWLATQLVRGLGILIGMVGVIMLIGRMNEEIGSSLSFLGLLIPIVPFIYGLLHFYPCRKGLAVVLAGLGLIGLSFLLGR